MANIEIKENHIDEYLKAVDAAKQRGLEKVGLPQGQDWRSSNQFR